MAQGWKRVADAVGHHRNEHEHTPLDFLAHFNEFLQVDGPCRATSSPVTDCRQETPTSFAGNAALRRKQAGRKFYHCRPHQSLPSCGSTLCHPPKWIGLGQRSQRSAEGGNQRACCHSQGKPARHHLVSKQQQAFIEFILVDGPRSMRG